MSSPISRLDPYTWPALPSAAVEVPEAPPPSPMPVDVAQSPPIAIPRQRTLADDDIGEPAIEKPCPKLSSGGINYVW